MKDSSTNFLNDVDSVYFNSDFEATFYELKVKFI